MRTRLLSLIWRGVATLVATLAAMVLVASCFVIRHGLWWLFAAFLIWQLNAVTARLWERA